MAKLNTIVPRLLKLEFGTAEPPALFTTQILWGINPHPVRLWQFYILIILFHLFTFLQIYISCNKGSLTQTWRSWRSRIVENSADCGKFDWKLQIISQNSIKMSKQVNKKQYKHKKGISYFNFVYKVTCLPFLNTKYCGNLLNSTIGSRKHNNFFHVWGYPPLFSWVNLNLNQIKQTNILWDASKYLAFHIILIWLPFYNSNSNL